MPFIHICPKHGPEPCPNMPYGHACKDNAKLRFESPTIYVDIPMEVG
jgi:hypothetical protein